MNSEKMGRLIAELRKSRQMTQKDLAENLRVSDKAVSKWECGLSCPDIALLSPLAAILGVTTNELLSGERSSSTTTPAEVSVETGISNALQYADKAAKRNAKSLKTILAVIFSTSLLLGIITCVICDLAISGLLTWSLYPITAIILAWFACFPIIWRGKRGIVVSLIAMSVLILPYLWIQSRLVGSNPLAWPISLRMALVSLPFCWIVFGVFKLLRARKLAAVGVSLLLTIPLYLLINFELSKFIDEPVVDIWGALSFSIIIIMAVILFALDFSRRKKRTEAEL